jgi:DNA polymerase-3 subunit beta
VDYFEIPIKDFKEMVQQTVFAVSDDETRFFMNGVFLEKSDDSITMVATDGRRMAHINKKIDGIKDFSPVIVPPKILNLMVKRSGNEGMIALAITPKNVFLRFGTYSLSSVVIDGTFPNYRKVIPEEQTNSFIINRKEILEALRRVSILVEQKSHRIYFNLKSGLLSVFSEESEMGDAKEEIPCKYEGEEVSLALNYSYMEEPFKVIAGEEILIRFTNSSKAITITSVPEADFFHIVMPMQP